MIARKERLTVTVDPQLIEAGIQAVADGLAESLSGWVNQALVSRAEHDRKLKALSAAIAQYEAEFGVITAEEMEGQLRLDRENAVVIRGGKVGADPR